MLWIGAMALFLLMPALPAQALASAPLSWPAPQLIDPPLFETEADIVGVSCPSPSLCAAIDANGVQGHILASTDPANSEAAWEIANLGEFDYPRAVSCSSSSFCAVADNRGNIWTATQPTGGIAAWTKTAVDSEVPEHETSSGFLAVSCSSASFCAAIDDLGNVFTSTNPAGGAAAWTQAPVGDESLDAIACNSPSLCVITDFEGNVLTSSEPMAGSSAWHSTHIDASGLGGVACPSVSLCVIGGFFGKVFTSDEPTGGVSAWLNIELDYPEYLLSVSCPSASFCAAVDSYGDHIITSNEPSLSGGSEWDTTAPLGVPEALLSISCPSDAFCVIGGDSGTIVVGTPENGEEASEEPGGAESGGGPGGVSPADPQYLAASSPAVEIPVAKVAPTPRHRRHHHRHKHHHHHHRHRHPHRRLTLSAQTSYVPTRPCKSTDSNSRYPQWHVSTHFKTPNGKGNIHSVKPDGLARFVAQVAGGNLEAFSLYALTGLGGTSSNDVSVLKRGSHPGWTPAGGRPHWSVKDLCRWRDKRNISFLVKLDRGARVGSQACLAINELVKAAGGVEPVPFRRHCLKVK